MMRAMRVLVAITFIVATLACGGSTPSPTTPTPASKGLTTVTFGDGGSGVVALPTGDGKHPAVLVIQEWWGLNDWIKDDTKRFADKGYVALAVDLYRGKSTTDAGEAHELMRGMPEDRAMADIKAAFELLAARPDVDAQHIGIIGWCM